MCTHQGHEHRTSPCHLCRSEAEAAEAARPAMPDLWDGDDA